MTKVKNRRWRKIALPKLQGVLCLRVCVYWIVCQIMVLGTLLGLAFLEGSIEFQRMTHYIIPAMFVSTLAMPLAFVDMINYSNRFAGPILNFRHRLREMVEGNPTKISVRSRDYFTDMASNLNEISTRLQSEADANQPNEVPQPICPAAPVVQIPLPSASDSPIQLSN
jgi:hypothetical protein